MNLLFWAAVCFALLYGLRKILNNLDEKTQENGFYGAYMALFAPLVAPLLVLVVGVILLIGVVCLLLAVFL